MQDLQLVHWRNALVVLTHMYPRGGEFAISLLMEEHSTPLPDRSGNPWKQWEESFSKYRFEQIVWMKQAECVCLQMRDEEANGCVHSFSLLGRQLIGIICSPSAEHSLPGFFVMAN